MTPQEFDEALASLGWKGSDFARKADVVDNTVWRWRKGLVGIPKWVDEYLGAMLEIQRLHARFVSVVRASSDAAIDGAPPAAEVG